MRPFSTTATDSPGDCPFAPPASADNAVSSSAATAGVTSDGADGGNALAGNAMSAARTTAAVVKRFIMLLTSR